MLTVAINFMPMTPPWNTVQWDCLQSLKAQTTPVMVMGIFRGQLGTGAIRKACDYMLDVSLDTPEGMGYIHAFKAACRLSPGPFRFCRGRHDMFLMPNWASTVEEHVPCGGYGTIKPATVDAAFWTKWDMHWPTAPHQGSLGVACSEDFTDEALVGDEVACSNKLKEAGIIRVDLSPYTKAFQYVPTV